MGFDKTKLDLLTDKFSLSEHTILLGYRGSIAHGLYIPNTNPLSVDDKDLMGVCIPPLDYYLGLSEFKQVEKFLEPCYDIVVYELEKMMRLLIKSNPNVLSLLWLKPNHYIYVSPVGQKLIDNRGLFVSRQVYYSFVGYARGQLHRMTHYKFEGYMGTKRKELVEKFGFDTKNASHLIRLLRMGIEFLKDGELKVLREHDAQELIEIKKGEWELSRVKKEAQRLFILADEIFSRCTLPQEPDYVKINNLLLDMVLEFFELERRC